MCIRDSARPEETALPKLIKKDEVKRTDYYIVDGYNVIFAWDELKELASVNLDSACESLIEILQNYGSYRGIKMCIRDRCMALHAEQNAIIQAAVMGNSVEGGTIYITHQPCAICALSLIHI